MKKIVRYLPAAVLLAAAAALVCLSPELAFLRESVSAYLTESTDEAEVFTEVFDLDLSAEDIQLEELYNDYGGFFGDGAALWRVTVSEEAADAFSGWTPLSLAGDGADFREFAAGSLDGTTLPTVTNGYWKLVDRSTEPLPAGGITARASVNASLCIYDSDTGTAYYLSVDT